MLWSQIEKAHGPGSTHPRRREFHETKPYPYYYVLAVVAFAAWALATAGPVRDVVGCSIAQAEYFVAAAALIMPLADVTLRHFWEWLPNMRKRMADRHVPARLTDRHQ